MLTIAPVIGYVHILSINTTFCTIAYLHVTCDWSVDQLVAACLQSHLHSRLHLFLPDMV